MEIGLIADSSAVSPRVLSVLIADDHALIRQALRNALAKEPDFTLIAEADNGIEAVKLAKNLAPDVLIMDIAMPALNGIEATRQIREISSEMIILILTVYDDTEHVLSLFKAGADGYLTKKAAAEEIIQAMRTLSAGDTVVPSSIFRNMLKYCLRYATPIDAGKSVKLTTRELDILELIAIGKSNKEISSELNISPRTVKSHCADIFCKLKAFSRTEAVITALRSGFITLDNCT